MTKAQYKEAKAGLKEFRRSTKGEDVVVSIQIQTIGEFLKEQSCKEELKVLKAKYAVLLKAVLRDFDDILGEDDE